MSNQLSVIRGLFQAAKLTVDVDQNDEKQVPSCEDICNQLLGAVSNDADKKWDLDQISHIFYT